MKKIDYEKVYKMALIVNFVQVILLIIIAFVLMPRKIEATLITFILLIVMMALLNLILVIRGNKFYRLYFKEDNAIKKSYEKLENLNEELRRQRHDFMNHLQAVYGLMEVEEYKEAVSYIEEVYQDITKINRFLRTKNPALNAVMQAKINDLEKNGIEVYLDVHAQMNKSIMPSWDICKILSNLLDNTKEAIYVRKKKQVKVIFSKTVLYEIIEVRDNAIPIDNSIKENMFDSGVTTKKDDGHGLGLAIVKDTVSKYGGRIEFGEQDEWKYFKVYIPIKDLTVE